MPNSRSNGRGAGAAAAPKFSAAPSPRRLGVKMSFVLVADGRDDDVVGAFQRYRDYLASTWRCSAVLRSGRYSWRRWRLFLAVGSVSPVWPVREPKKPILSWV